MARFNYFTLEEVYAYAERLGYSSEKVGIKEQPGYDYDNNIDLVLGYEVSFGHEYTEVWVWEFEDLSQPAVDYEHIVWKD